MSTRICENFPDDKILRHFREGQIARGLDLCQRYPKFYLTKLSSRYNFLLSLQSGAVGYGVSQAARPFLFGVADDLPLDQRWLS
jgi:hypothetical protein